MGKMLLFVVGIIIGLLLAGGVYAYFFIYNKPVVNPSPSNHTSVPFKPVIVTKETLPVYIQKQEMVKSLPDSASIGLKLYNFNSGEREWEESYVITKGKAVLGSVDSCDLVILIHSKYVPALGNFCPTIQKAKTNGDFGIETNMSQTALLWKYKGMMKYKDCLGM